MNLKDLFTEDKALQTKKVVAASEGAISIQLKTGAELKEHVTRIPAFLICVFGEVVYKNEKGASEKLIPGDFVNIEPNVIHWLKATTESNLLLIK